MIKYSLYLQEGGTVEQGQLEQLLQMVDAFKQDPKGVLEQMGDKAQDFLELMQEIAESTSDTELSDLIQAVLNPDSMKCGGKVRAKMKKVKKGELGVQLPKDAHGQTWSKSKSSVSTTVFEKGGKPCPCQLKKVGGKIVEVDCNGVPVHRNGGSILKFLIGGWTKTKKAYNGSSVFHDAAHDMNYAKVNGQWLFSYGSSPKSWKPVPDLKLTEGLYKDYKNTPVEIRRTVYTSAYRPSMIFNTEQAAKDYDARVRQANAARDESNLRARLSNNVSDNTTSNTRSTAPNTSTTTNSQQSSSKTRDQLREAANKAAGYNSVAEVKKVQQKLRDEGFDIKVDGWWGPKTLEAWDTFLSITAEDNEKLRQDALLEKERLAMEEFRSTPIAVVEGPADSQNGAYGIYLTDSGEYDWDRTKVTPWQMRHQARSKMRDTAGQMRTAKRIFRNTGNTEAFNEQKSAIKDFVLGSRSNINDAYNKYGLAYGTHLAGQIQLPSAITIGTQPTVTQVRPIAITLPKISQ